jgi:serine/threonine protein kinase/Tfp pilus assembly protein PilF
MIGSTILHYKILEKLGEGGMGIVYLAEDLNLERKVAIKFLPRHIASNSVERERFKIEAKAAAALNHPNIATIHAIEESDDDTFIVMEYIDGIELKDKIKSGPILIKAAINIAIQIAEGLEAAHKKGIVHRDIKSQNIMITNDGKVKIMDFGLAKIRGGTQITKIGTTVGTLAYMSPEQAKGEGVDHRTDIWSFGVVLYEMLTGQLPFMGEYEQAIIYSIINEEVKTYSDNPSSPIQKIINNSLKKDPGKRYLQVSDIIKELRSIEDKTTSGEQKKSTSEEEIKKLAVLPFINIRNDEESNYLGFAVADRIIGALAYNKNILVRPSSAIRSYQNQTVDIKLSANQLNVDYVLTGNFLKEVNEIRLNLELIDINSGKMLWREDFEVEFENVFKLQDIISKKVITDFNLKFTREDNRQLRTDVPKNPLAYEFYLKSISYTLSNEDGHIAVSMIKKSLELDSTFAPAYSELGFRYSQLAEYDINERKKVKDSEENYKKALSINEELLSALLGLAGIYTEQGKSLEAIELIKKALKINPNNAEAHFWLGYIFRYTGFLDNAIDEMETAVRLDSFNPRFRSIVITYSYLQQYEDALKYLNFSKETPMHISWHGIVLLHLKKYDAAKDYFEKAVSIEPEGIFGIWSNSMLCFITKETEKGLKALKALEGSETYDAEQLYLFANVYGLYGEKKDCIRLLDKCIEDGFFNYQVISTDPFLDPVRDDPDFQKILSKAKSKHENFKKMLIKNSLI